MGEDVLTGSGNESTVIIFSASTVSRDFVCACTSSLVNGDTPLVDVSNLEATTGGPELTVAVLPRSGEIVLTEMSQRFHVDHLERVMEAAIEGCTDVYHILDKAVRGHVAEKGGAFGWEANG